MRIKSVQVTLMLLFGVLSPVVLAQDKPVQQDQANAEVQTTPIKVQVVFTEFEGDKKVKSLPYSIYMNAADANEFKPASWVKLRIGSRVPLYAGKDEMQYIDVGTNIDARAAYNHEGNVLLQITLERSWVEGEVAFPLAKSDIPLPDSSSGHFQEPIIRAFKSELEMKLRKGQIVESTVATDPISGRVDEVEVSFALVK